MWKTSRECLLCWCLARCTVNEEKLSHLIYLGRKKNTELLNLWLFFIFQLITETTWLGTVSIYLFIPNLFNIYFVQECQCRMLRDSRRNWQPCPFFLMDFSSPPPIQEFVFILKWVLFLNISSVIDLLNFKHLLFFPIPYDVCNVSLAPREWKTDFTTCFWTFS